MRCISCNGKGCWRCDASCGDPDCLYCAAEDKLNSLMEVMEWEREAILRRQEEGRRQEEERKAREYAEYVSKLDKKAGAYRLFRTWRLLDDGSLVAMVTDHIWKPGENVSKASSATNAAQDSGFHGFASLTELQRQEAAWWEKSQSGEGANHPHTYWYVCGTMLGYGHVKEAEKGARVQKAIPEYIIEPDGSDPDFGMLVVNAAEKYGIRIISVKTAEEMKPGRVPYWKGRPIR